MCESALQHDIARWRQFGYFARKDLRKEGPFGFVSPTRWT